MATVTERTTKTGTSTYIVFWAVDRQTRKRRQFWERQPSKRSKDLSGRKAQIEAGLIQSKGLWPLEEQKPEAPTVTVASYADEWLEGIKPRVRPRVWKGYELSLRLHVKPLLGDRPLTEIGPADLKKLRDTMQAQGKTNSTINAALVPLRSLVRDWAENTRVGNPIAGVRLFRQSNRKVKPPTVEQVEKAIRHARPEAQEALRVAAATGLRRGELFALRWQDIDTDRNLIHVHASNYGGTITETTKTEDGERYVPLFTSIRQLLLERKARERYCRPEDFVFGSQIGTPLDPGNFSRREWKPALKNAGLQHWRFHDLRHFAVSQLIAQRADILLIANIAGHKDPAVTLRVYSHLMTDRLEEAATLYDPLREAVSV